MARRALVGLGGLLLLAVAISAAPWGGGAPREAWVAAAAGAAALLLLGGIRLLWTRERVRFPLLPSACFAAFAAVAALQSVPLPAPVVEALSPARMELERASLAGIGEPGGGPRALSIDPDRTAEHALRWATFAAVLVAASLWVRRRRDARIALAAVALLAAVEAGIGLANGSGTFVNRNHYGALLAVGFLAALGLVADRAAHLPVPEFPSWSARISAALNHRNSWQVLLAAGLVVMTGLGLAGGLSRGAAVGAGAGLLLFLARARKSWAVAAALAGVAGAALWVGLGPLSERFTQIPEAVDAEIGYPDLFRIAWRIFEAHPAAGAGVGTYGSASAAQWSPHAGRTYALFCHNDYLEALAGAGWIGGTFFLSGLAALALWGIARARHPLAAGALGGVVAVMVHANAGFTFQMPGVALPFALLAGTLAGPAFARRRAVAGWPLAAGLLLAGAALGAAAWRTWERPALPPSSAAERIARTPAAAAPLVELGWEAARAGDPERADRCFRRARALDGASGEVLRHLAAWWRTRPDRDEHLAVLAALLWSGSAPPDDVFEEAVYATGSLSGLARLLPPEGHPARARWERERERFLAQRLR